MLAAPRSSTWAQLAAMRRDDGLGGQYRWHLAPNELTLCCYGSADAFAPIPAVRPMSGTDGAGR
jgi:hypothetical protein